MRAVFVFFCAVLVALPLSPLSAQDRRASHCIALAEATPGISYLHKASWTAPVPEYSVRIRYLAHASFLIQTEGGLNAVTDFTGFTGSADFTPDVVTMNHAHETHWTAHPDPAIPHVLRGWGEFGEGVDHHLDLGEMLVRNVPTDIRSSFGGGVEVAGNSIFVFEVAGLCIGHLGHLHHMPTSEQFAALGRLDVVMAAVDGGMTLALPEMVEVLRRLRSSVILPMHWFTDYSLERFLTQIGAQAGGEFDIVQQGDAEITVSLRSLPDRPTIHVLRPAYLRDDE